MSRAARCAECGREMVALAAGAICPANPNHRGEQEEHYAVRISLTNETAGHIFAEEEEQLDDFLLTDDGRPDWGRIYRRAQDEYGRCQSSVYVDASGGPKRVGWFFVSRQRYTDTGEPYLRGAWVTVVKVRPASFTYESDKRL